MENDPKRRFLGIDLSTQRLKAVVVNEEMKVLNEANVIFDSELPEFRTIGGVCRHEAGEVVVPTIMWVKALDILLDKLLLAGTDFSEIVALSGAAQQHGSVWWSKGSQQNLSNLRHDEFLHLQLANCFTTESPVWLDSSTTLHCRDIENAVGGPQELARITGSTAYERFTGSQIRKIFKERTRIYQHTERISLISSFVSSLFIGDYAPVDLSDGSGMNLLDINKKEWHPQLMKECGGDELFAKLGDPVPTASIVGSISKYYVERYGFKSNCKVVAFTGDNCSAFAGLHMKPNWIALSLGTSDTLLVGLESPRAPPAGHILVGPTDDCHFMALLCFSNGSLTREKIRDEIADGSWNKFSDMLHSTVRGNLGNMGIFFLTPEIVPKTSIYRGMWSAYDVPVAKLEPAIMTRALIEGQAIARKAHAHQVGAHIHQSSRIIATGGASTNKEILQIFADVFNVPVYVHEETTNAAALGGAIRAADVWSKVTGITIENEKTNTTPVATPYKDVEAIYEPMLKRYEKLIETLPKMA